MQQAAPAADASELTLTTPRSRGRAVTLYWSVRLDATDTRNSYSMTVTVH
jgi:hypothetical protein